MKIGHSRALLNAALDSRLTGVGFEEDSVFGVQVPTVCEGVPSETLRPRNTWADTDAYDRKAQQLARLFEENFKQFEDQIPPEVRAAGLKVMVNA